MKAGTVKVGVYINGEKVDGAELLDVRYDRAKTQDLTNVTEWSGNLRGHSFTISTPVVGVMRMSAKAFDKLVGLTGPGTRLRRARKWHMNRAERRELAKERHLEAIAKFYEVARRAAAINPSVSFGEIAWAAI